ncbi:unnamed protein product [Closterium sp. NIES-64]|nr:unnamed protein product [Closterium sp. NIES-64]
MGALRHRFLLALVLVASLNFLAVFAAQPPPDGYYGARLAGASLDGDAAADLKQTSDDLSGSVKKAVGQAGRNVRNSIGSMTSAAGVPKKQGAGGKLNSGATPKKPAAAAAGATGAPKKQEAGAKDTSGAAPESPAAPAAANEPRALLEAADSDAVIDSVDSVDFDSVDLEGFAGASSRWGMQRRTLKQTSDDLSGSVKKAVGQAGRNVRNSIGSMVGVPPKKGKKKHHRRGGKKAGRRGGKKNWPRGSS